MTDSELQTSYRDIYGSFSLADTEFAFSVKAIQEVVNAPDCYSSMPLAPDYLLGLFNLRGMILPVIDLSKVFGFCENTYEGEKKIAIVEHGEFCVGLLFDKTGEIFNGDEVERSQFSRNNGKPNESVIQGVFKLDGGKRIIQILDPHEILKLDRLPQSKDVAMANSRLKKTGIRKQCISFRVGEALCAIDIDAIQEIVNIKEVDTTALSTDICLGVINIRGEIVPTLDFGVLLGYQNSIELNKIAEKNYKAIVMRVDNELLSLVVNSVESIISYFKDDIVRFPILTDKKRNMFKGCISSKGEEETILLEHKEILSNDEILAITRGHKALYEESIDIAKTSKELELHDVTYITFSIDGYYALEINEVIEVIECPENIIEPPNMSDCIKGMINLRGEMITVIDPRVLYHTDNSEHNEDFKVLIFKVNDVKYGLMVDSVDSIVSLNQKNKVKIPEVMGKNQEKSLTKDIKYAIQVDDKESQKTFLVLNLSSMVSRVVFDTAA